MATVEPGFRFRPLAFQAGTQGVPPAATCFSGLRGQLLMKGKTYTFFIASTPGKLRKLIVPAYVLHGVAVLAMIGTITVVVAAGSYTRMLWKVGNYNAVRHELAATKQQYRQLQTTVNDTNQRLDTLRALR